MEKDWITAGKIAAKAREYAKDLTKIGTSIKEICQKTDDYIISQNAVPAFPSQLSINHIAAHFCPDKSDTQLIQENDLIKIDVGACFNGAIGDTALTVDPSNAHKELLEASKKALEETQKILQIGTQLKQIGRTIQDTIQSYGFSPIRNLGGHGLGKYQIHTDPHIPNYDNNNPQELKKGQTIAIEPFATDGEGFVKESSNSTLFSFIQEKPVRLPMVREIIKDIKNKYNTLPFTTRWLEKNHPTAKVNFALKKMLEQEMIISHPPLVENKIASVSQHEHSFIIDDKITATTKL